MGWIKVPISEDERKQRILDLLDFEKDLNTYFITCLEYLKKLLKATFFKHAGIIMIIDYSIYESSRETINYRLEKYKNIVIDAIGKESLSRVHDVYDVYDKNCNYDKNLQNKVFDCIQQAVAFYRDNCYINKYEDNMKNINNTTFNVSGDNNQFGNNNNNNPKEKKSFLSWIPFLGTILTFLGKINC